MLNQLAQWIQQWHIQPNIAEILAFIGMLFALAVISWAVNFILKRYILHFVRKAATKLGSRWGQLLVEHKVFRRLSHLGPGIVILMSMGILMDSETGWIQMVAHGIHRAAIVYMLFAVVWFLMSLLSMVEGYYQTLAVAKSRPIRGYMQVVRIIIYCVALILAASELLDKSPWAFFTGLGALSAVLLLVFKDTILGFVASIQVSAYDMVRVGDWITIPSYNADGDVLEVTINTVKVQNFDKTIVTVPTYALTNAGVQNWRGMVESGGRRIKRAINIDLDSIRFADAALLKQLEQLDCLQAYLQEKRQEIQVHNQAHKVNTKSPINGRSLTNIGLFRAYIEAYLRQHNAIHKGMTFLVRQLAPSEKGLPIELYVFTNDTDWGRYEAIQSDVFDHLLAAIHIFDLAPYQTISSQAVVRAIQSKK